jgi:eukaryotic-like serine/threonine-protein kinase
MLSGSVLGGKYRLEARIGEGGMAEVFRGLDVRLDRPVAIKILKPDLAKDPGFVERFQREAQAVARLNHPGIVSVFDSGSDDGTHYIVMELIEGRTLGEFLAGGGHLSADKSVEIAEHVCDALGAAHANGVIHRDIKPGNIIVDRRGVVKVTDFGIAHFATGPDTLAKTATVLGTAAYLSPEQAKGEPVDERSDIYSLGCVLYEMLTNSPPFGGDSAVAVATKHVNEAPVPPSARSQDVPPRLDAVVMRALAKNPANRYPNALAFKSDLERARTGQDVEATPLMPSGDATQVISRPRATSVLPPIEPEPEGSTKKVLLGILIGVLIVGVLGGGIFLLLNSILGDNPTPTAGPIPLPNLVGKDVGEATNDLTKLGLVPNIVQKATGAQPPGTVIGMAPAAGTPVARGATVTLTVAKAPVGVQVPSVTGLTVEAAKVQIETAGLTLGTQTQEASSSVKSGEIISQDPAAGTSVPKNTPVNVVVSSGPQQVTVRDVTCESFGRAKNDLSDIGLNAVISPDAVATNPLCPNGNKVAQQDPPGGTTVDAGSTVTLYAGGASPSPT